MDLASRAPARQPVSSCPQDGGVLHEYCKIRSFGAHTVSNKQQAGVESPDSPRARDPPRAKEQSLGYKCVQLNRHANSTTTTKPQPPVSANAGSVSTRCVGHVRGHVRDAVQPNIRANSTTTTQKRQPVSARASSVSIRWIFVFTHVETKSLDIFFGLMRNLKASAACAITVLQLIG